MAKIKTRAELLGLIVVTLVLVATIVITRGLEHFDLRALIIGSALVVLTICIVAGLGMAFSRDNHEDQLETLIAKLTSVVSLIGYPWLYDDERLAAAEGAVTGKTIWIVSPDLINVTEKASIRKTVRDNLSRGVHYTYIVPDTGPVKQALPHLKELDQSGEMLEVISLKNQKFRSVAVTHIAIFNPEPPSDVSELEVYIELPIQNAGTSIRGFWIRVENQAAKDLVGRFWDDVQKHRSRMKLLR